MAPRYNMCDNASFHTFNIWVVMKMKYILKKVIFLIIILVAIYEFVLLWNTINWDSTKIIGIVAFVLSMFAVSITISTYLMSLRYKEKRYYISFPIEMKKEVDDFRILNNISATYGSDTLVSGNKLQSEIRKKISRCAVCFVIIGNKVTLVQKTEIHEMKKMGKKIIPIQNGKGYMPNDISSIVPIIVDEGRLKDTILS